MVGAVCGRVPAGVSGVLIGVWVGAGCFASQSDCCEPDFVLLDCSDASFARLVVWFAETYCGATAEVVYASGYKSFVGSWFLVLREWAFVPLL